MRQTLLRETYVVLKVPEPQGSAVVEARRRAGDIFRARLPAELTLIGSSGAGSIRPEQRVARLLEVIAEAARTTAPIAAAFAPPIRFANSTVFAFPLVSPEPVLALHRRLKAAELHTRPSPWPYLPHCTLSSRAPVDEALAARLLAERVEGVFELSRISVFTTDALPKLELVARFALTGR